MYIQKNIAYAIQVGNNEVTVLTLALKSKFNVLLK